MTLIGITFHEINIKSFISFEDFSKNTIKSSILSETALGVASFG